MTPDAIAREALARKDEQPPESTIVELMGLEEAPKRPHTLRTPEDERGHALADFYAECLNAFCRLVAELGDTRAALPKKRRLTVKRASYTCQMCGKERRVQAHKAKRFKYCSTDCADEAKRQRVGPREWGAMGHQKERNAEIVRRRKDGEKLADIARDYGISDKRVYEICARAA